MSGRICVSVVVLKKCKPEGSYILAELLNTCLKESCFQAIGRSHLWLLYLRMLGRNYGPVSLLFVSAFSLDISKAFNRVWHAGLLRKHVL